MTIEGMTSIQEVIEIFECSNECAHDWLKKAHDKLENVSDKRVHKK